MNQTKTIGRIGAALLLACTATACAAGEPLTAGPRNGDTLAFLGDSITAGGASYGGYCRLVVQGLKSKGVYVKPVLAGVPGNTSRDMLARLEPAVLKHEPDWVVVAAGVNDIWHGDPTVKIGVFQPKPGMGVKLPEYQRNMTAIVDRCTAAGARVMLTTITPIREDPRFKLNQTAASYNAFLRQLAGRRKLPLAKLHEELFAEIAAGRRMTSDGVHPIPAGHRAMARGILRAMGFGDDDLRAVEREWLAAPRVLILGDRQTTSGGRTGGWCHLLMDAMNSGREMVTYNTHAQYRGEVTAKSLLAGAADKLEANHRCLVFQAPFDDARVGTPIAAYREQVAAIIELARQRKVRPVLVTIPVRSQDPADALNAKAKPYNDALRVLAKEQGAALADIQRAMAERYAADPTVRLTFDGERFNRAGSILMTETLMRAMGLEAKLTPFVRELWSDRSFYAER